MLKDVILTIIVPFKMESQFAFISIHAGNMWLVNMSVRENNTVVLL